MAISVKRQYMNLAGVDFKNEESLVELNRSPDALNIWRNYDEEGNCIRTRPGYSQIAEFDGKINGIHLYNSTTALVHSGTKLYLWNNFPSEPQNPTVLSSTMNNITSSFFIFDNKLYINDGVNYLVYDGTLRNVSDTIMVEVENPTGNPSKSKYYELIDGHYVLSTDTTVDSTKTYYKILREPYVPTTSIGRSPLGGGTMYQDVNVLQPKRTNTFVADGTSTEYLLDTTEIDSVVSVYVNDTLVASTDYTVNTTLGKVIFNTAPTAPDLSGTDNVVITYSKVISSYTTRISSCTISQVFDNRCFFTGNNAYKNTLFHSELNDPTYISDLSYYEDGTTESAIKSIVVGNNILWVFKEPNQDNATVFYHIPTLDYENGKIYPSKQGNVSTGCYSESINFNDDIVFISKYGLEGINGDIAQEQLLAHRSSLVDNKMVNTNNFEFSKMYEWKGYLLILTDKYIFLADSRQKFQGVNGMEYEWYLWNIEGANPNILKEYKGNLYIGGTDGKIYVFTGTNDNGNTIISYWTTPMDAFGYSNMMKTTNKRGGVAKIKTIPNGIIKISEKTNKSDEKYITSKSSTGFDYSDFDYSNFSYTTTNDSYIVYKIKEKKFLTISLKFYSDELDRPFGLFSAVIEAFIGGYVKR